MKPLVRLQKQLHKLFVPEREARDSAVIARVFQPEIDRFISHDLVVFIQPAMDIPAGDRARIEDDVCNHLYDFFQRILLNRRRFSSDPEMPSYPELSLSANENTRTQRDSERYSRSGTHGSGNNADSLIYRRPGHRMKKELGKYIIDAVLPLESLGTESLADSKRLLLKTILVRNTGYQVISLLERMENIRKKIRLKKKFIVESNYCMTLNHIPRDLYPEIVANAAQRAEWTKLFSGKNGSPESDFPCFLSDLFGSSIAPVVIDTRYFNPDFKDRCLAGIPHIDAARNGILIHSDNFHALRLLNRRFEEKIQCIYIDPPFNTETNKFSYKDNYQHSVWLRMMNDRIREAKALLTQDGTIYVHIDYNEKERLKLLLEQYFVYITEIIWRIGWVSGFKSAAKKFIRNHETIYQFAKSSKPFFRKSYIPYPPGYRRRDGKRPRGKGYPLEDTWNCSDLDPLHSIQIMSFSREKLGNQALTQKNENLLARMITSSTREQDWILDFFLGSGTTCAAAHKLGRKWIGVEIGEQFDAYILPRMKRVLYGEKRGISSECGWKGGGFFQYMRLESYTDVFANVTTGDTGRAVESHKHRRAQSAVPEQKVHPGCFLKYVIHPHSVEAPVELDIDVFADPWNYHLFVHDGPSGQVQSKRVDIVETFNLLLGIRVTSVNTSQKNNAKYRGKIQWIQGTDPDRNQVLVVWRYIHDPGITDGKVISAQTKSADRALQEFFRDQDLDLSEFDSVYINGYSADLNPAWDRDVLNRIHRTEVVFKRRMFDAAESIVPPD